MVRIGNVIANFPESMIEIAGCYDENSNDEGIGVTHTLTKWGEWKDITKCTTKEIQVALKVSQKKQSNLIS